MLYLSFVKQGDISYSNYKHQYNKIHQTDRRTDCLTDKPSTVVVTWHKTLHLTLNEAQTIKIITNKKEL